MHFTAYRGRSRSASAKRSTTCDKSVLSIIDFSQEIMTRSLKQCDVTLTVDFIRNLAVTPLAACRRHRHSEQYNKQLIEVLEDPVVL